MGSSEICVKSWSKTKKISRFKQSNFWYFQFFKAKIQMHIYFSFDSSSPASEAKVKKKSAKKKFPFFEILLIFYRIPYHTLPYHPSLKVWRYRFSSFWIFAFLTWKIYVESIGWIWPWKYRQFDVVLCYNHLIIFSTDKNNRFLEHFLTYKNFEISQKRLKEGIIIFLEYLELVEA